MLSLFDGYGDAPWTINAAETPLDNLVKYCYNQVEYLTVNRDILNKYSISLFLEI